MDLKCIGAMCWEINDTNDIELKPGLNVTILHRFSRRFNMDWMHSFDSIDTWRYKM